MNEGSNGVFLFQWIWGGKKRERGIDWIRKKIRPILFV